MESLTLDIPSLKESNTSSLKQHDTSQQVNKKINLANYLIEKNWSPEQKELFIEIYTTINKSITNTQDISSIYKIFTKLKLKSKNKHSGLGTEYPPFNLPNIKIYIDKENNQLFKVFKYKFKNKTEFIQQKLYVTKEIFMHAMAYDIFYNHKMGIYELIKKMFIIPEINGIETSNMETVLIMEYLKPLKIDVVNKMLTHPNYNNCVIWKEYMKLFFEYLRKNGFYHNDTASRNIFFINYNETLALAVIDFGESEIDNTGDVDIKNDIYNTNRGETQSDGFSLIRTDTGFNDMSNRDFMKWVNKKWKIEDEKRFGYFIYGGLTKKNKKKQNKTKRLTFRSNRR